MTFLASLLDRVFPSRNAIRTLNSTLDEIRQNLATLASLKNQVDVVGNQIAEVRLWLEKISVETGNAVATPFNQLFNVSLHEVAQQSHTVAALVLGLRAQMADRMAWRPVPSEKYRRAQPIAFDDVLTQASRDFPSVFTHWETRLHEMDAAFSATKAGNAANALDLYSQIFKSFFEVHACGRILDVGCGVFGKPFYLADYPSELISGVEPLEASEPADFERVRGIAEYLPWPDESFATVVNATSLDHVLDLQKSMSEIERVLLPNGTFVLWIGAVPGSPSFDPTAKTFTPADQFHLFHFDTSWFDPLLEGRWEIADRIEFSRPSFSHVFYALKRSHAEPSA